MLEHYASAVMYRSLSRFPSTQQDISLQVNQDTSFEQVSGCIQKVLRDAEEVHGYECILEPVDVYQPERAHTKNITFRITLYHQERTLVTKEVNKLLDDIAQSAENKLHAKRI